MSTGIKDLDQMSLDMESARRQATFPVELMTSYIYEGMQEVEKQREFRRILVKEPLFDQSTYTFLGREEKLHRATHAAKRIIDLAKEHDWNDHDLESFQSRIGAGNPLTLHFEAFVPVVTSMGTAEQSRKWIGAVKRQAVLGCYAQTELAHGSNVLALKTTATFDRTTDEFVINTPDLTAAKWLIGGLGLACTHAVVQAQLIISGKSRGPHLFIVPIRSIEDHKPRKGVTVGDIGPKAYGGFATVDNGYAMFDNVRIPRENMLMRFSHVTREGIYVPPVHDKLSYGSMVKIRVDIVYRDGWELAKAVLIAIRYSTIRRQFGGQPGSPNNSLETQVMSYSGVQHRLLPLLSLAYGWIIAGQDLSRSYSQLMSELAKGDANNLPEMHVTSCALKVWCTRRGADGMEECRKALGGHGYSIFSGISHIFATFVPANTYEGDNYVLSQQVARHILKQLQTVAKTGSVSSLCVSYLENVLGGTDETFVLGPNSFVPDHSVLLALFGHRASRLAVDLAKQLESGRPWSDVNMECWNICLAHAEYDVLKQMINRLGSLASSEYAPLASVLNQLTNLFALSTICETSTATFLSTSTISPAGLKEIQVYYRATLAEIAPNAIGLTDAFDYTDFELNSALGVKNGRAYEALWAAVQNNPVNKEEGRRSFQDIIKKITNVDDNVEFSKASKL
ncbi:acyl-CoA dehydrogenase/oxidase C-terminal [Phycomyces nitens]|nr:acyl-CoA dehydrogenase/oxidase C-terminal [Phycomyces nitens]